MAKRITPSQQRRLERRKQSHTVARSRATHKRLFWQLCILAWLRDIDIRNEFWFLFVEGGI